MCKIEHNIYFVDLTPPEVAIANAFRRELGIDINPQALRILIRKEWDLISKAAHKIHEAL